MTRYDWPDENEWVQPVRKGYKMACCDCALVHDIDFRIHDGHIQFRVRRNNRSTAVMRRHMGMKLTKRGTWTTR